MGLDYATEAVGKQITEDLRRFGRETGQDGTVHLPDFLEVDPAAPFETWKQQFVARRTGAGNANEGDAQAAIRLCQDLTPHFADEDAWRRLLNRLGRDHIDADVASLARRLPSPDRVRRSYASHVETLAIDLGVPDALEVVAHVYAERGLDDALGEVEVDPDDDLYDDDLDDDGHSTTTTTSRATTSRSTTSTPLCPTRSSMSPPSARGWVPRSARRCAARSSR